MPVVIMSIQNQRVNMASARDKLFGTESKCDAGPDCLFGGNINRGEDVLVCWMNRGTFPLLLADLMSLDGMFEVYHIDCAIHLNLLPGETNAENDSKLDENDEHVSETTESPDVDSRTGE